MPPRLDPNGQQQIDDAWDQALTPVSRCDGQSLLDLLVTTQAYQLGVDTLAFRSEKRFSGGKVVMEIAYDRSKPGDDRFTVTVSDRAGKPVRVERYGREQVEQTVMLLNQKHQDLKRKKQDGTATPVELRELQQIETRIARIEDVLPKNKTP